MIEAALQWASEGIPVFPVAGKIPRTEHGCKDATTDEAQIQRWWREHPDSGIGGATGAPCGCWVLDLDGPEGLAELARLEEEHGALPATRRVRTGGGGLHLWFRMPPDRQIGNRARVRPGVDVRGTGGYVVLPPSGHPSGGRYSLLDDSPPTDAPGWLLDLVSKPAKQSPKKAPNGFTKPSERRRLLGMVAAAADRIRSSPEGTRNDTANRECYTLGGYLDAAGVSVDEIAGLLEAATSDADQPTELVRRSLEDGRADSRPLPPDERPTLTIVRPKADAPATEPRPTVELGPCESDPLVLPMLVCRLNTKTEAVTVLPTLPNAMTIFDNDRRWKGRIKWNQFADRIEIDGEPITDDREAELVLWMTRAYGATPSTTAVHEAVNAVAHRHPYHPVREYFDALVWDGVSRLDLWLETFAGIDTSDEDITLIRAYAAKWLISIVARVYQPPGGVKVDTALIFAGPMGLRKSSVFRLLGGAWFGDSALPIGDKDGYQAIAGKLIWELAELESVSRRELGTVKAFMTSQIDTYRPSYGRNTVERPRQCVFCGTVNSDSEPTFLRENDRRWWIVRICRAADLAGLAAVRDQLFAEAIVRYRAGESWWLDRRLELVQRESVSAFVAQDPWHGAVERWATGRAVPFTVAEVLEHALKRDPLECNKTDEMRAASILGKLGFERKQMRVAGVKGRFWVRRDSGGAE